MSTELQNSSKVKSSWVTPKVALYIGLIVGGLAGIGVTTGISLLYLMVSHDSISFQNGQMSLNKSVSIAPITEHTEQTSKGDTSPNIVNRGDGRVQVGSPTDNSPEVKGIGNYNTITIISNRDLPGYSNKGYSVPPPDLSNYTKASNFQLDYFLRDSSDNKIDFGKKDIVILGTKYTSAFDISYNANSSRFVFKLDGTQKAALIQFGIPDLKSGNTSTGAYTVKIYGDNKELWTGECKRGENSQIISASLSIPSVKLLTIEVTSNGQNDSNLFFTSTQLLKE